MTLRWLSSNPEPSSLALGIRILVAGGGQTTRTSDALSGADVPACWILEFLSVRILGLYWGYIGIMEKNMETIGIIGLYRGPSTAQICDFAEDSKDLQRLIPFQLTDLIKAPLLMWKM